MSAALIMGAAQAADTGNGSKNFRTPSSVPNYFSNEAGPMLGPASETQRGQLYSSQAAVAPREAVAAAPAPQARQHIAMAEPRGRLIRGRRGERIVAHHIIVHGRVVTRVAAHGSSRVHTAYAATRTSHTAAKGRTLSRTTRVSSTHRHARG